MSINHDCTGNDVVHLKQCGLEHLAGLVRALRQECRFARLRRRAVSLLTFAHHLTLQEKKLSFSLVPRIMFFWRTPDKTFCKTRYLWRRSLNVTIETIWKLDRWFILSRRRKYIVVRCTRQDIIARCVQDSLVKTIQVREITRMDFNYSMYIFVNFVLTMLYYVKLQLYLIEDKTLTICLRKINLNNPKLYFIIVLD